MKANRSNRRIVVAAAIAVLAVAIGTRIIKRIPSEPAREAARAPECGTEYRRFFSGPRFEVRVVFGYKDARPARFVADRYERMLVVERLVAECSGTDVVCGFRRDPRDVDLFTKDLLGPDGRTREIRVVLAAASIGPDDETNRADPYQRRRSAEVRARFLSGLRQADVVLYNGHSRAGGGPDFRPPRLRAGHVDYAWYRTHEPGLREVLENLRSARGREARRLRLLGFLSCASTSLFVDRVERARPKLATVSSPKLLYFADANEATIEALASVLGMGCDARRAPATLIGRNERKL